MNGRELALFEVAADDGARSRVIEISSVFRGRVVVSGPQTMVVEVSGLPDEIDALGELLGDFGLTRMVRSGPITIAGAPRGNGQETRRGRR